MQNYYLGINSSHDASVCLFKGNTLIAAIEEERLNKDKHSICFKISGGKKVKTLPHLSISYVLEEAGIGIDDLKQIYINDCELLEGDSINKTEQFLRHSLCIKDKSKIIFIPPSHHHLMHAYNAYYLSHFKESIILVVDAFTAGDGGKKRVFESIFYAKANKIKEIYSRPCEKGEMGIGAFFQFFCKIFNFNIKLGGLRSNYFGLGHDEAGKLMGLSSHGRKYFTDNIVKQRNGLLSIRTKDLYKFALKYNLVREVINPEYFDEIIMTPDQVLLMPSKTFTDYKDEFVRNLAYFAQKELEKAMFILVDTADKIKRINNLCISGGVALNCLANGRIKEKYKNKSVYVPFAPADNGNAIGSCFYAYARDKNSNKKYIFNNISPFLGKKYTTDLKQILFVATNCRLDTKNLFLEKLSRNKLARNIAEFLYNDLVVAFITGGSEFGPRALGNRSILANPFNEKTKEYLNNFIKKREWFRPFAPVVLSSHKNIYFKTWGIKRSDMSFAVKLRKELFYLSAIKNADNTSRIQIINPKQDNLLVAVIKEFGERTGAYLLLNTSCNIKGLPIIEHPLEIFYLYKQMPVDVIVIEDILIIPQYDIFQQFMRYKENKLDDVDKEKLADRFYQVKNYYRAKCIYRELFKFKNETPYLLKIFKSLFFMLPSTELHQIFCQLKSKKSEFFNNIHDRDVYDDYRIYMGLYEICHGKNISDFFGLNELILTERNKTKKKTIIAKCAESIFSPFGLSVVSTIEKKRNKAIKEFLFLLKTEAPNLVSNPVFQKFLWK